MDLSKAFDCMPHALLIAKLHAYGMSVNSCHLMISYLKDRLQRVKIMGDYSDWSVINRGVPQGSVLGPILFNIFVNDLFYIDIQSNISNHADDNNISYASTSIDDLTNTLTEDTLAAINWCKMNGMEANADKFQCAIMDRKGKISSCLSIHDSSIHSAETINVLGIKLDCKLSFNAHIADIAKRASKQINILKRLSKFLDEGSRMSVYKTFISANFNYCPVTWIFCGRKNTIKLEKLQERAFRFV